MTATKILWGQILTVFAIVLTTTWSATQSVLRGWRTTYSSSRVRRLPRLPPGRSGSICSHGPQGTLTPPWRLARHGRSGCAATNAAVIHFRA